MTAGTIASIQVGRPRQFPAADGTAETWTSAISKSPVIGSVAIGRTSLAGDESADTVHHGGPDKAVLAYALAHYALWNREFPEKHFQAGGFGENLTIAGLEETGCCIGDTFRIGECLLQVTQPRQPCWKLSRYWDLPDLATLVQQNGRSGWYLRVLQEGVVEAGMAVVLIERRHPDITVAWASSVLYARPRSRDDDLRLADCPELSESWKTQLTTRVRR